jgi:capsular polysaccharide biosynthesis protein
MLGLDPDDFPTFDFEHVLEVDELTVIHNDRLGRETVCSVRDAFRDPEAPAPHRCVYISRAEATYRRLVNEDEVWALLQKAGFERVRMEALSFEQQVQLMRETAVLVAPHGAGLANMLFLDPSACVVEIAVKEYPSPDFYAMAASLGLRYGVLFGVGVGDRLPPWRDLRVPAAALEHLLAPLSSSTSSH